MTEKHFIVATAGHVDHGKSALVKALTGTDPDRLPEEKRRDITIDLGFAELILDRPNEGRFRIGLVDVPGHEDFIRNMIAGVGSIDLALLVVAADDGWMPQTEEHVQILTYLGVKRAVVTITKSDLAKARPEPSRRIDEGEIRELLRGTPFADSPIVPTSTHTGDGIENLQHTLAAELAKVSSARDIGKPRLFIDRAFTLRGIGTVVTGTLTGGTFSRGQTVSIQPRNLTARIRSIQSHGRDLNSSQPATRTALNLTDVEIGTGNNAVCRGDVIASIDLGLPSKVLQVLIERSSRLKRNEPAARPIKNRSSAYLHHGASRVAAKIFFLRNDSLVCGERAIAELRLQSPIFAFVGDRFVLRDPSERFTIGGGVVLDVGGEHPKISQPMEQLALLSRRAAAPHDPEIYVQTELARRGFAERASLLRQSNFGDDEIAAAVAKLDERGEIVVSGEIAADAGRWQAVVDRAIALIDDFHKQHPEQRGLELSDLRVALGKERQEVFEAVVAKLCRDSFAQKKSTIARKSHRATLPAEIGPAAEKVCARLAAKPFDPPGTREIAPDRNHQQALRFLIEQGDVVEINPDLVLLKTAGQQMQSAVIEFISKNGPATASELRQYLGSSRRVIIPFLEYLDAARVTQRRGDRRALRSKILVAD
jgi:selenocysteine-specific elongation factor